MAALRLSTWGIQNPIPVALLFIAAMLGGVLAYVSLPTKKYPDITYPLVAVTITQQGAAPDEIETQITRPIEDELASIPNIKTIHSEVRQGVSTTRVQFQLSENLEKATDEVRTRVEQARTKLPREIEPPTIQRVDFDDGAILTYAVAAPQMTQSQLSWFVDDAVTRALQAEPGVAQVARVGGVAREINVVVDPDRLAAHGVTVSAISQALAAVDVNAAGGRLEVGAREQSVRVLGSAETVDQLRRLDIPLGQGLSVKLSDVADVADGAAEPRNLALLDGHPVVGFQVFKTNDASEVSVESKILHSIKTLQAQYPGVRFTEIYSTVDDTRQSLSATLHTLIEGMILAALVVWAFLREWRATLISALAMPVALIPTFLFMQVLGYSLNIVTLLALTLVIGILVDDAIVEVENIQKRVEAGVPPYLAAKEGADEIGLAVIATTACIVVVFAPVSFMDSIPGQFFKEFGITVVTAVLVSLLVARLLTPLLAAYFLRPAAHGSPSRSMPRAYRVVLEWTLSHRWITCAIGGLIFIGSLALAGFLPTGFQPPGDPNFLFVRLQGPPGSTLSDMTRLTRQATDLFRAQPETRLVFGQVGLGGSGDGDLSVGVLTVVLKDKRSETVSQIEDRIRGSLRRLPDARVSFLGGGFSAASVQIVLTSQDAAVLDAAGEELQREMNHVSTVGDPRPSAAPISPEILIRPKSDEAARLGVTPSSLASLIRVATIGDFEASLPKFTDGERRLPIRVRLPREARENVELIKSLQVPTAFGSTARLGSIADIEFQAGPARIVRLGRQREIAVEADLRGGAQLGQALHDIHRLPVMRRLPPGVQSVAVGDADSMKQLFEALGFAISIGVGMIYAVLVLLFRSFFKPLTILSALPLAVGGTFLALLLTGLSLSLPSLIGILMLLGLAAKNSILLVEHAIEGERDGVPRRVAVFEACRERVRPIIMTTIAMAAGMLPTAFALGKGAEFRQPMAVAVIGGLATSTGLSLIIVPAIYVLMADFEDWILRFTKRWTTPRET